MLYLVLHCPTGHLSAVTAGIAAGVLPVDEAPSAASLSAYTGRVLRHRQYGRLNPVGPDHGIPSGRLLVMGRGTSRAVIDTALGQIGRITAGNLVVQAGPAIRLDRSAAGYGALPTPAPVRQARLLHATLCLARAATNARMYRLADWAGGLAARQCYDRLAQRASSLPIAAARLNSAPEQQGTRQAENGGSPRALYHCFGATHSSIVAAALHTGILQGQAKLADIQAVPGFDARSGSDIGRAVFVGQDEQGRAVFVVGFNGARGILTRAYQDLLQLTPAGSPPVVLADTLSHVSVLVKVGGYLSRRLRLIRLGRALATMGIARSIPRLQAVVAHTQAKMSSVSAGGRPDLREVPAVLHNEG